MADFIGYLIGFAVLYFAGRYIYREYQKRQARKRATGTGSGGNAGPQSKPDKK